MEKQARRIVPLVINHFFLASKNGDVELVNYFILFGASTKTRKKKSSPLYEAVMNGRIEILLILCLSEPFIIMEMILIFNQPVPYEIPFPF